MSVAEGHGVNGSTSVSKTESLGSNPSAPAKQSLLDPEGSWIEPDGINALRRWWFYRELARTGCHQMVLGRRIRFLWGVDLEWEACSTRSAHDGREGMDSMVSVVW